MENKEHGSGGGFVWGLLIGAAVGSLVSTQKGRQILKDLMDHGLESLENVINIDEVKNAIKIDGEEMMGGEMTEAKPVVAKRKRLFRGIRRK